MIAKNTFWFQRILFLFLFTFLAVSSQQKVDRNDYDQNIIATQKVQNLQPFIRE